jgi:2-polyprenyl-6-methoxyphenol hydroxylase-like FAD-dependent oxidoreductase
MSARAVVIGGSLAGMLAARALSDRFTQITILERDVLAREPAARRGTPQARHQHTLMPRGLLILEAFFPGLQDQLIGQGAVAVDLAADVACLTRSGWTRRFRSGLMALTCSRDLLEWAVRERVRTLAGVRVVSGRTASGLALDDAGTAITGVRLRGDRGAGQGGGETMLAGLVVDASGRGSRTPEWLEDMGFPRPEERVVDARVGYASRIYRRPVDAPGDWKVAYLQPAPRAATRGGMLFPIEGGRWQVSLVGYCGDHPPTDEVGFLRFSETLRSSLIYEAIRDAEPLSPIVGGSTSANRVRRYEALDRRPEGLIVVGDAACAFNPVFAQGMTVAALGAEVLARCLVDPPRVHAGELTGFAERFQRRLARALALPWCLNALQDGPLAGTAQPPGRRSERLLRRYLSELGRLGCEREGARRAALELAGLVRPPLATLRPPVLAAMLGHRLRRRAPTLASRPPPAIGERRVSATPGSARSRAASP